jgi:hypothetical protein
MKRFITNSNSQSRSFTAQQFNELLTKLSSSLLSTRFDRKELQSFVDNARILLNEAESQIVLECNAVVSGVPEDLWKTMFLFYCEKMSPEKTERKNLGSSAVSPHSGQKWYES